MSEFMIQLSAVAIAWGTVVTVAYFIVRWCFEEEFSAKKIVSWVTYIAMGILATIGMYYVLPERYQDIINTVLNHLVCAVAVHTLLLRSDAYLKKIHQSHISKPKLYMGIIFLYLLMALDTLMVIKVNSHTIVEIAQLAIMYLTRGSILMCLVLEVKLRGTPDLETVETYLEEDL